MKCWADLRRSYSDNEGFDVYEERNSRYYPFLAKRGESIDTLTLHERNSALGE